MSDQPVLGVIGGSGVYRMEGLEDVETRVVETPFGAPSSPLVFGNLHGKRVVFLARHGVGHFLSPTEVNYRANIYALKSVGVQQVVGISACGSLREDYEPGHFVVPDQIIDFTKDRARTFFTGGLVAHVGVADPFCPDLSQMLVSSAGQAGGYIHPKGTMITIEGPRFSTRGESNLFRAWGVHIIGMTTSPEAFLAREAEMCYAVLAHITDYDVWHTTEEPVSVEMVIQTLSKNTHLAQDAIRNLVANLPQPATCDCARALSNAFLTHGEQIDPVTRQKLGLLVEKYLRA
jgi:5'-methylthioadenosine phosphorylase